MFPQELMVQDACEMSGKTYAFGYLWWTVEDFEKSCQSIENILRRDFRDVVQFFTWYVETNEDGRMFHEVQGMVQFKDETGMAEAKSWFPYKFSGSVPHFLQRIQDVNVNKLYRYIKKQQAKVGIKTFERGAFVDFGMKQDPDVVGEAIFNYFVNGGVRSELCDHFPLTEILKLPITKIQKEARIRKKWLKSKKWEGKL